MATRLGAWLVRGWEAIRQLSGDDAYARYLAHHAVSHPGIPPLSRKEHFCRLEAARWEGVRRCC